MEHLVSDALLSRELALSSALLRYLLRQGDPPPERHIFVNRNLRMESVRYVGFDLDWTLADYRRLPLEKLTFQLATERLVDHHGYPEAVRQVEFRPDFPRRGLLIDKRAGTVLRMNRHRFVNLAYHGRERLDRQRLRSLYRFEPIQPASERFYHLDSLFELPEANLFAELVELSKHDGDLPGSPQTIFDDVRAAIDWLHAEGALKRRVLSQTASYLDRDVELGLALSRLALGGRRLFLLTNSGWSYVDGLCSYLFDGLLPGLDSWKSLFDLVIVHAGKPDFFRLRRLFGRLDESGKRTAEVEVPQWGGVYEGGGLDGLMRLIAEPGESVLYVGDHIYGDIVSSKLESTWRTALIVHELEEEIPGRLASASAIERQVGLKRSLKRLGLRMDQLRDLVELRERLSDEGVDLPSEELATARSELRRVQREHRRMLARQAMELDEIAARFNPYWGSFFKQGSSKTRFASQLENYACLYTSRASNFVFYGSRHYFRLTRDPMMHELD
ncbi:MAG: HAD-IG family 5'-nucleotidase [Thermoanaerobaculia bacterium]